MEIISPVGSVKYLYETGPVDDSKTLHASNEQTECTNRDRLSEHTEDIYSLSGRGRSDFAFVEAVTLDREQVAWS